MSDFPEALYDRILAAGFARSPWTDVDVKKTRAGGRLATDWGGGGDRWEFTVRVQSEAERLALVAHFGGARGRWGTWNFTCPRDGDTLLVQYDQDALAGQQVSGEITDYAVQLVSTP